MKNNTILNNQSIFNTYIDVLPIVLSIVEFHFLNSNFLQRFPVLSNIYFSLISTTKFQAQQIILTAILHTNQRLIPQVNLAWICKAVVDFLKRTSVIGDNSIGKLLNMSIDNLVAIYDVLVK